MVMMIVIFVAGDTRPLSSQLRKQEKRITTREFCQNIPTFCCLYYISACIVKQFSTILKTKTRKTYGEVHLILNLYYKQVQISA